MPTAPFFSFTFLLQCPHLYQPFFQYIRPDDSILPVFHKCVMPWAGHNISFSCHAVTFYFHSSRGSHFSLLIFTIFSAFSYLSARYLPRASTMKFDANNAAIEETLLVLPFICQFNFRRKMNYFRCRQKRRLRFQIFARYFFFYARFFTYQIWRLLRCSLLRRENLRYCGLCFSFGISSLISQYDLPYLT